MSNSHQPDHIAAAERLDEVARILALGVLRLRARQTQKKVNDRNYLREFKVDFPCHKSVCGLEPDADGEG